MNFRDLVTPIDPGKFLETYWSQLFVHIPGAPGKFAHLLPWDELNRVLSQHRLEPPRLRLEKTGTPSDDLGYTHYTDSRRGLRIPRIDLEALYSHLRNGATLVLDAVDELSIPISLLAENLTGVFGVHVQINAYAAWGKSLGFPLHWDDHDVLVLQVSGRKKWRVFEPTRQHPMYRDIELTTIAPTNLVWEGTLNTGDFLYLPRGWWHDAVGIGESSLHLTCGVNNRTGIHLLEWIADECRSHEFFRQDLPQFKTPAEREAHADQLRNLLLETFSPDVIDRFLSFLRGTLGARPHLSLPYSVRDHALPQDDSFVVRFAGMTHAALENDSSSESFSFRALGREWALGGPAKPLIESLLTGEEVTGDCLFQACEGHLTRVQVRELLEQLLRENLIALRTP